MKNASFSFVVMLDNIGNSVTEYARDLPASETPFDIRQHAILSHENEMIYPPAVNYQADDLEEIRSKAHALVDSTVDAALQSLQ